MKNAFRPLGHSATRPLPGGFLLLEACITIAVVSIGLVWLTRSFAVSASSLGVVQDYTAAVAVLQEQLTLVRAQEGVAPGQTSGRVVPPPDLSAAGGFQAGGSSSRKSGGGILHEFEWVVDVREASLEDGAPAPVLPTTVRVSWTDRRGTAQVEAATLLPRRTETQEE